MSMLIYLIGSLRNPRIPEIEKALTQEGFDVFASWYAAGEHADDSWRDYEQGRGLNLEAALRDYAAQHVFEFDKYHLDRCDIAVLVMPAGKSCHIELGYAIGRGKRGLVLLEDEPNRYDVMLAFTDRVCYNLPELIHELRSISWRGQGTSLYLRCHRAIEAWLQRHGI